MAGHGVRSHPSRIDEGRAATPSLSPMSLPRRRRIKWLGISIACVLFVVVVLGALALTVFSFRDPDLKLESIAITNISLLSRAPATSSSTFVKVTLREEIMVRNQNWGSFKIDDSVAVLTFRGARIYEGEMANPGTSVKKRSSRKEALAIEAELINGTSYRTNYSSEVVEMGTYAYVSGKVSLLSVIKRWRSGSLNCTVSLSLATQAVQNFSCR